MEVRYASEVSAISETADILEAHLDRVQAEIATMVPRLAEKQRRLGVATGQRLAQGLPPWVTRDEEQARDESTLAVRRRALGDLEDLRQRRLAELRTQLAQQLILFAPEHPAVAATRRNVEILSAPSLQVEALNAEIRNLERDSGRRGGSLDGMPGGSAARRAQLLEERLRGLRDDPRLAYEQEQLDLLYRQSSSLSARLDAARMELDTARATFRQRYSVLSHRSGPRSRYAPTPCWSWWARCSGAWPRPSSPPRRSISDPVAAWGQPECLDGTGSPG